MLILKAISALLSYPGEEMLEALSEMEAVVKSERALRQKEKASLLDLINSCRGADLIELQQRYVELFDRGRSLSLHLFEHIHGESRDRGQAMIDLMQVYQTHGFEINVRELPDFIPLFLEYLAHRPAEESLNLLRGALPVLNLLGARLAERKSPYATLFDALSALACEETDQAAWREKAASEEPDVTLARMDEIWEEEAISFMGNTGVCQNQPQTVQPVAFAPRARKIA